MVLSQPPQVRVQNNVLAVSRPGTGVVQKLVDLQNNFQTSMAQTSAHMWQAQMKQNEDLLKQHKEFVDNIMKNFK